MDGGGLRLSHKHNWFQYEDGAKKPVPATKGSLGIDYGEQNNENEENVDIAGLMKKYGGKQGAGGDGTVDYESVRFLPKS